jgi:hypothetical protein
MKKPSTPYTPEAPAWEECEICRDVPGGSVGRLEGFEKYQYEGLMRCPLCFTFYLLEMESDPHGFMGEADETITRIDTLAALRMLASMDPKKAKQWMAELNADARIPELVTMLKKDNSAEAAATLARIYQQRGEWDNFEALLRHRVSIIRGAALAELTPALENTPPGIIDAFVSLLGDKDNGPAAHEALTCRAWWDRDQVSPLIVTLVECLEHDNAEVRAFAVDSIFAHLSGSTPLPPSFEPGKPPKLGKAAKVLTSKLPRLVRHIVEPLPAPWPEFAADPSSDMAREFPKKLNAGIGALRILEALITESKASEARVRKALSKAWPQLLKIYSDDDVNYRFRLTEEVPILGNEVMDLEMKQLLRPGS